MLTVGDDELVWETMMMYHQRLPRNGTYAGEASIAASQLRVSGKAQALAGATSAKKLHNCNFLSLYLCSTQKNKFNDI